MKRGTKAAALGVLAVLLAACGHLANPPKPFEGSMADGNYKIVAPGDTASFRLHVAFGNSSERVVARVVLADPCAQSLSHCPNWDNTQYPGVSHPTGQVILTPQEPEGVLYFRVSEDAPPQGPFKYEVVLSGSSASGLNTEQRIPLYVKILRPNDQSALDAWNYWRDYLQIPTVQEDPELSWSAWLHSRYAVLNYPNNLSHNEDLSQPFATERGKEAARIGNEWGSWRSTHDSSHWPPERTPIEWWIAAPFHRFALVDPAVREGGFGIYRDVGSVFGYSGMHGRNWSTLPVLYGNRISVDMLLLPAPDREVALNRYQGTENPYPTAPCMHPNKPTKRPLLTHEDLQWDDGNGTVNSPIGLPITVQTFPQAPVETEVLQARLTRLSDSSEVPLCAYGSTQYWEPRDAWAGHAKHLLRAWGAVIALPYTPLMPGEEYEAYLKARFGSEIKEIKWTFHVAPSERLHTP